MLQQSSDTRLCELPDAGRAAVISIDDSYGPEVHQRLLALGVYPGAEVSLLRRAPLGDPLQVRVDNTLLSIRNSEARAIVVQVL